LPEDLYNVSLDETVECQIYDAENEIERKRQVMKTVRKVFVNRPITLTVTLRNPLLVAINLTNLRLVCASEESKPENPLEQKAVNADFECPAVQFQINPNS